MLGWKTAGADPATSSMSMPQARKTTVASGKYKGEPLGLLVNHDPGYVLWLSTNGYGTAKQAAIRLVPYAHKVIEELTQTSENSLGGWTLDELPY